METEVKLPDCYEGWGMEGRCSWLRQQLAWEQVQPA